MTISEIAKLAGVSNAAVSRYLNDGYLSEEKRLAIKKVIEETGYKPSAQAQNLRTKKTKLIGVIIPKIDSSAIGRVVTGIQSVLEENGYQLLLANTQNSTDKELKYLELFDESRVDGIIFIATIVTPKHKKLLKKSTVPVVIVGQYVPGFNCVYHDDYNAMRALTELMISRGKNNVGYVGVTMKDEAAGKERYRGYCDAVKEAGHEEWAENYVLSDFSVESGYEYVKELVERNKKIDGIVCATDNIAVGVMMYLKEKGKKIPGEVAVMGMGDTKISRIAEPSFSTVHYYYEDCGIKASEILIEIITTGKSSVGTIKMGYFVIENET